MKYRVLKNISLLSIAQAGPKDCFEFESAFDSLTLHMRERLTFELSLVRNDDKTKESKNRYEFFNWAEKDPKRIQWLIDKGFIERVEELKPCPFCPKGVRVAVFEAEGGWYVRCDYCHARGPYEGRRQGAIKLWNRRA